MTGTGTNTIEETIQQNFLWVLGPIAAHQIPRTDHRIDLDNNKAEKLIKINNRYYLSKRKEYNSRGDFVWTKQTNMEALDDILVKLIEFEKECDFPDFSTELLISEFITSTTDRKLQDKLLRTKDLDVPKLIEKIQHNTYYRINKKNTILKALISNHE